MGLLVFRVEYWEKVGREVGQTALRATDELWKGPRGLGEALKELIQSRTFTQQVALNLAPIEYTVAQWLPSLKMS